MSDIRALMLLNNISKKYPQAWDQVAEFRKRKGKDLPDWPNWCFLPMAATYAIVSEGGAMCPDKIADVAILSALSSWRYTQGVYHFDPRVYQSISNTVVNGDLPIEVLFRLPEWCLYVETPDLEIHGFFAHLEHDINTSRAELRLLIDDEDLLYPIILHLGEWTVTEAIERSISVSAKQGGINKMHMPVEQIIDHNAAIANRCISLLLYLCSEEPDIQKIDNELPKRPSPTKTKKGWKLFPPKKPKIWHIGEKVARMLDQVIVNDEPINRNSPKPHIRRAHWHGFWVGKRGQQGRKFIYKWLPPTVINAEK